MNIELWVLCPLITTGLSFLIIPFLPPTGKPVAAMLFILLNVIVTSVPAVYSLMGDSVAVTIYGGPVLGNIPLHIDALSAWFLLIINFTSLTGCMYGTGYMKAYSEQNANLSLHWISFVLFHISMLAVCVIQNGFAFLMAWELMSLSSFMLIIFEHDKKETRKAGLNYLVQMHLSVIFLSLAFIWVYLKTGSYNFASVQQAFAESSARDSFLLFLFFFIGFSFKAGFIPFHTWLPYAHPAAPSHISGVMSGVIIKLGIYGIFRIVLFQNDYLLIGWMILAISVFSGIYGVMLAIIQHNVKKLLAYHSIENIGIIGIGIGLGCIGIGIENRFLAMTGFAGALLHTLNHSLFKSMLFYGAGNVYQATHTLNMEALGGLMKRMPQTALLFLMAALAICGLPPFNGFISELLIYSGLYRGIIETSAVSSVMMILAVLGLVLIGGLAILCFTKAFGIIFLGTKRPVLSALTGKEKEILSEASWTKLLPMYMSGTFILAIGLFPQFFFRMLGKPLALFIPDLPDSSFPPPFGEGPGVGSFAQADSLVCTLQQVSWAALVLIALSAVIYAIRSCAALNNPKSIAPTWGCGYVGSAPRAQYTANSFVRIYRKLAEPVLSIQKKKVEIKETFPPLSGYYETHPYDKLEEKFIDVPLSWLEWFFMRFRFLQNGQIQYYILYGVLFLLLVGFLSLFPDIF